MSDHGRTLQWLSMVSRGATYIAISCFWAVASPWRLLLSSSCTDRATRRERTLEPSRRVEAVRYCFRQMREEVFTVQCETRRDVDRSGRTPGPVRFTRR